MAERLVTCHRKWIMVTCAELTAHWDQAIGGFLGAGPAVPPDDRRMRSWFESYRGRGRGAVNLAALPEPYLGTLGAVRRRDPPARHLLSVGGDLAIPGRPMGRKEAHQPLPHLPPEVPANLDRAVNPDRRRH